ncbi:MAG: hypothetical protein LQ349_009620 [Xanthoria aureola]|nr:MAG: hypothetical protein LQ349_009620 [Xanthoria aureola]
MDMIKSPQTYNVPHDYVPCYQHVLRSFANPHELTEGMFPYFGRPFKLRTQDDKAAWFMTELARVQPPQTPTEVKLLQYIHCRLIYQMKRGIRRRVPYAIHVAFSMPPARTRPERVILSTSLNLLSVFGSTISGKGPDPDLKDAQQLQNYNEIADYFPDFRNPIGPHDSVDGANPKMGHCCEDKPWKALAGHPNGSKPIVDPATIYGWSVRAKGLLKLETFDPQAYDQYRMPLCKNCELWISATGGNLAHFDTFAKMMVEP